MYDKYKVRDCPECKLRSMDIVCPQCKAWTEFHCHDCDALGPWHDESYCGPCLRHRQRIADERRRENLKDWGWLLLYVAAALAWWGVIFWITYSTLSEIENPDVKKLAGLMLTLLAFVCVGMNWSSKRD